MKLTDVNIPGVGKGNLLKMETWTSLILGVFVLIVAVAAGQNLASKVASKAGFVDTTWDKPFDEKEPARMKPIDKKIVY